MTTGICNIAIGIDALGASTTGCFNIALGAVALGGAVTTGINNIAMGANAMDALTSGATNIAIGCHSLGASTTGCLNVAIGNTAMGGGVTTGKCNIAIGSLAMDALTSGTCNVAIGPNALGVMTTGIDNIAIGSNALGGSLSGCENIAIGCSVMCANALTGIDNIAMGVFTMDALTSGKCNLAIGFQALGASTTGCHNVAIGACAIGKCVFVGSNSVAIGQHAICQQIGGERNVAIGYLAGSNSAGGNELVLLGANAGANPEVNFTGNDTNQIALGDHNSACFLATIALTVTSDARDKTDVADLDLGLDYIKALRPVYYRWDKRGWYDDSGDPHGTAEEKETYLDYEPDGSNKRNRWEIGLLAQEVLAAEKLHTSNSQVINEGIETVANEGITVEGTNEGGYQIQYQKITMPLIKAVKELDSKIVALTARVADLE